MFGFSQWLAPQYWSLEPVVMISVELAAVLYLVGRTRRPRVVGGRRRTVTWRDAAFFSGLVVILIALDSPVDSLARQLFWMHMTQHLLLIVVAAPLLVTSAPGLKVWRGLPLGLRRPLASLALRSRALSPARAFWRWIARPAPAFALSTLTLWAWHLPWAYDVTLRNHLVHHLEHLTFFGFGLLFWAQVIDQPPFHARLGSLQRAAYVFAATVQSWVLAGILAMSGSALYAYAQLPSRPGGISALTDQVIGAGIMWVPGSVTYAVAFVAFLFYWLDEEEKKSAQPRMI